MFLQYWSCGVNEIAIRPRFASRRAEKQEYEVHYQFTIFTDAYIFTKLVFGEDDVPF